MEYVIKRVLYRLRWNWWLSMLIVIEIAMGISVFTYSSNLHYSLVKEENKVKEQKRDLVLEILSKEEDAEENVALTWQDYKEIQQLSEGEAYIYIGIPGFYSTSDKNYNYTVLLVDYEKANLEKTSSYWGSNVQELMNQELLVDLELQNKTLPETLDKIASSWIHIEWNSTKMKNVEETIEKVETYLTAAHGDYFSYRIYYPEIELRNNSEKTRTSIQAISKASELFLVMFFVGMLLIFHLLFEHRKETYGISMACGANRGQLFKEIFVEILILSGVGTIVGSGIGVLLTYHLNLQIMIEYIEVVGDFRTILWNIMICFVISFVISMTVYRKLRRERIVQLLKG